MAVKIAEHPDVRLPVMVCQDGFITSHGVENVETLDTTTVKMFIKEHEPFFPLLDTDNPISSGPLDLFDYYFEHKRQQSEAMMHTRKVMKEVFKEFSEITGKKYGLIIIHDDDILNSRLV